VVGEIVVTEGDAIDRWRSRKPFLRALPD
jgi:hypothetical protein